MPPTFAYMMCLMVYLTLMGVGLVLSALLFLVPSKRRLALQGCLAILGSLPGILVFQFVVGTALGVLTAAVLGFYAVFDPSDWVRWVVGIPAAVIMQVSFTAASVGGCYTGGRIGWQIGGGTPVRAAIADQKMVLLSWFRKGRA